MSGGPSPNRSNPGTQYRHHSHERMLTEERSANNVRVTVKMSSPEFVTDEDWISDRFTKILLGRNAPQQLL